MMNRQNYQAPISHTRMPSYVRRPLAAVRARAVSGQGSIQLQKQVSVASSMVNAQKSKHRRSHTPQTSALTVLVAVVIILSMLSPLFSAWQIKANYDLSAAKTLLGSTPKYLRDKLKYDMRSNSWQFNEAVSPLPTENKDSVSVGDVVYAAKLPGDILASDGLTLTDTKSKMDIKLKPQFAVSTGQEQEGHVVYPLVGSKSQLVYSFKNNGVKEDIILYQSPGDTAEFSYTMQLPTGMEAHVQKDGSVGIFGGDPTLFSNISYGSDKDRALVDKARQNSDKTHLYYEIPAPVINGDGIASVKAKFVVGDDTLTVKVSGLDKAQYPLSIDPSFVMNTSGCSWQSNGNNGDNISYSGCQIGRSGLSGGPVGTWSTASAFTQASYSGKMLAYHGYMYLLSGQVSSGAQANSVQYAAINSSTGNVGTWNYTHNSTNDGVTFVSGFNLTRSDMNAVIYNGYMYVIGGTSGSTVYSDVQYARINADGTVGSWTTDGDSSMTAGRFGFGLEVYNSKLYAFGGCTSISLGACSSVLSSVERVSINANGSLNGSWTTTGNGSMTTTRFWMTSAVYNGYLYAMGGCVSISLGSCTSTLASVEYAPINNDGTVGTWVTTTSFATGRQYLSGGVYNGYLYMMGGGSFLSDVQLAKIYANGSLGSWQTTTSFSTGRQRQTSLAYNGYLYMAGGCTSAVSNCGSGLRNDVQYSQISTTLGAISPFSTNPNNLVATGGSMGAATAIYGGYMYLLGGATTTGSNFSNRVLFAKLNTDGTTGTWTTTTSFTDARTYAAAAAYNGYLYVAGGQGAIATTDCAVSGLSTVYCRDIQKAPINSDGTIGTWVSAGGYYAGAGNPGRDGLGMVAYGGYMYVIGGNYNNNSSVSAEVDVAPINSDGTVGTWTQNASALGATGHSNFQLAQFSKYVYIAGGRLSGNTTTSTVIYASLSSSGGMSAWASAGSDFTTARTNNYAATYNGYLYIAAGYPGTTGVTGYTDVQYAKINTSTGALSGGWTTSSATLATSRTKQAGGMYNGYLYIAGGCNNNALLGGCNTILNDIEVTSIYNGGGGADNTWTSGGSPGNRFAGMSVASGGFLFAMGGCSSFAAGSCTGISNTTSYAAINSDGSLGTWTTGTSLPRSQYGSGAAVANGYVYIVGGCSSGTCSTVQNTVDSALICTGSNNGVDGCGATGGTLGTWHSLNTLSSARWLTDAIVANGYLYVAGGRDSGGIDLNTVQSAQILSSGGLGSWGSVGSGATFTTGRYGPGFAKYGDYLYILGGTAGTAQLADVQMAQVQSGGQLGAWSTTMPMPATGSGTLAAAANGYMYFYGTRNGNTYTNRLMYAPILSDGTLGTWSMTAGNDGVTGLTGSSGVVYNGYIYRISGFDGNVTVPNSAYFAPLLSTPQIARYSLVLSTDLRTLPASYITSDSLQSSYSSNIGTSVAVATATTAFSYVTSDSGIQTATKYPLTITSSDGGTTYVILITLDDSGSFVFGESSTAGTSMSYFKLNYHPNPAMRLRGGKTFNSNQLQSLDAP